MTLIQQFVEKALSSEPQFELQGGKKERYYHFAKYRVGKAIYIFGDYSYNKEFALDKKLDIQAIVSDGDVYIVDEFTFDLYGMEEEEYPENVSTLSTKIKEVNNLVKNELFPKYYNELSLRTLTPDEQKQVARGVRGVVLSQNGIVTEYQIKDIFNKEHVAKLLCGTLTLETHVNNYFEENKEKFITIKSESNELKRLVAQQYNVENWEVEMANALRNLDAKTVNVEFNYNGECATEKVEKDTLLRMLVSKDYFSSYNFVNGKSGEKLIKKLDVGNYRSHKNGVLECKHIQSITYGKKVIYSVMQYS